MTAADPRDLELVRKSARDLARRFDLGYWREKDKKAEYPWEFVRAFADAGWLGAMIPEEYGGLGLGLTESAIMMAEVAASGAGMSGASAIHFYVFPPAPILRHGSEQMKRAWLPKPAKGEILMAFGVTEPTAGADTSRITTRAEKIDGGWLVNGQKVWTTNGQNAQKILLLARTSPRTDEKPLDGMTLFFTDLDRNRITVREIEKLARPAVDSNELFIDNLEVADDQVVGEVGQGFRYLSPQLHLHLGPRPAEVVLMSALLDKLITIVTGGAQGIGRAIAEAVLAHGGRVLVADVDGDRAREAVAPLAAEGANIATARLATVRAC
jgi:acyl-CoA dehydrogenase